MEMYQPFVIVLLFAVNFVASDSFNSLIDLTLDINPGNYIIHAIVTEVDSGIKFFVQEYISSTSQLTRGKIVITSSKTGEVDVHYTTGSETIQRLVIHDNQCDLLTYKNASKWGSKIPGVNSQFTSNILLLGPSMVYRLQHSSITWISRNKQMLRGASVESIQSNLPDSTSIYVLYKSKSFDVETGIFKPMRLMLSNSAKGNGSSKILIDYYVQSKTNDELDKIVTPKPGIGCSNYLTDGLSAQYASIPLIPVKNQLHFITLENVYGPEMSTTRNQFFADQANGLLYLDTTSSVKATSQIYDYTLGVIYQWMDSGYCTLTSIQPDSPGVDSNRQFKLTELLGSNSVFKYVGQVNFEARSGLQVDVWESIGYTYNKVKYDKVVRTVYFVKSPDPDSIFGYIPVGATINLYNQKASGEYSLIESIDKVYYDFGVLNGAEEYRNKFQVSDCYPSEEQKTLEFHFSCSSDSCDYFAKNKFYSIRDAIKNALLGTEIVSASRISDVDVVFSDNDTIAFVTFLEAPTAKSVFTLETMYITKDSLSSAKTAFSLSVDSCMTTNAYKAETFEALAYCDKTNTCAKFNSYDSIVQAGDAQNGTKCQVFRFPLRNFYRFSREEALNKLKDEFSKRKMTFNFIGFPKLGSSAYAEYKMTQVVDVTQSQDEVEQLYEKQASASKLTQDNENVLIVQDAGSFTDCYRACTNSDDDSCETFSFCQYPDKVECLVSSTNYVNISNDKLVHDASCKIYSANHINDYIKVSYREFKSPSQTKVKGQASKCANACYNSADCKSFQVCDGRCSFGETYTTLSTKFSRNCNIYTPKVGHKYTVTGGKIVSETFHTEYNLNFDQCAALCDDWSNTNETCVSFNFCPKARTVSSCSLTKFYVANSETKSTESNVCQNYQLADEELNNNKRKQSNNLTIMQGTTGGAAFGIIMLFIAVGLTIGFAAPFVYGEGKAKINRSTSRDDKFTWSRQVNENYVN